jgi:hypothetical protein
MHDLVYVPALVFVSVAGSAWVMSTLINLRERRAAPQPVPVPAPARPRPRLVLIEGGLSALAPYRRSGKIPLRSPIGAPAPQFRASYGG